MIRGRRPESMTSTSMQKYRMLNAQSAALDAKAQALMPGGLSRDVLHSEPFPIYLSHGRGGRVHGVDGHEYVDLVMGNGALLLGHSHPLLVETVTEQVARGVHLGGCGVEEIQWAQLVLSMFPSAEQVRFTNSGSEATHLALRLARAFTGRSRVLRFVGHFHGWHDGIARGSNPPHCGSDSAGVPSEFTDLYLLGDVDRPEEVERLLAEHSVAAIIVEPSGGKAGLFELPRGFLSWLRQIADRYGSLLIFDEVVTGFRWAPGGAQATEGVRPDLTTLGKILGGGLPAGAVAARRDIMDLLAIRNDSTWNRDKRVHHGGTFNANPLVAAVGARTLAAVADGEPQRRATAAASYLRERLDELWVRLGLPGGVHGTSSVFHVTFGKSPWASLARTEALRRALSNHGVLMRKFTGITCSEHGEEDLARVLRAFAAALTDVLRDDSTETYQQ